MKEVESMSVAQEVIDRIKESGFRRVNLAARPSDDGP